jgi:hypothetical protein
VREIAHEIISAMGWVVGVISGTRPRSAPVTVRSKPTVEAQGPPQYRRVVEPMRSDRGSAVIFDLWGTLVPFDAALWANCEARIVDALGADAEAFKAAWHADYPARIVGTLEDSFRRACLAAGVPADKAAIRRAIRIRRRGARTSRGRRSRR